MLYGELQFFDIIIFAAIAGFLIYRLRSVLGKRNGFEKKTVNRNEPKQKNVEEQVKVPSLSEKEIKFENIYKVIKTFDHKQFLEGAKKAFEIIITSFNNGDKNTLKSLVSNDVYRAFEKAIDSNQNNPKAQFYSLIIDGIEDASVNDGKISISVNFTSEQMLNNDEASIVKNRDTWTFEKPVNSSSPKWTLTQT